MSRRILYCLVLALLLAPSGGRAQTKEDAERLQRELGKLEEQLAVTNQKLQQLQKLFELSVKQTELAAKSQQQQIERSEQHLKKLVERLEARDRDQKALLEKIAERNVQLIDTKQMADKLRAELVTAQTETQLHRARSVQLQERVRELEVKLARMQQGLPPAGKLDPAKDTANPPPLFIKGAVKKIDKGMIQISIGSDAGLSVAHTLEVYRLQPQAMYLGRLRIVNVDAHTAVGHMEVAPNVPAPQIRVGDEVASKLTPR